VLTGTAYRTTVPAAVASFVLHSGVPRRYVKTAQSGNQRIHTFCGDCGSPIYSSVPENPVTYGLRVGALAQRDLLPPRRQIWCRSALPWSGSLEGLPGTPQE
jgi:hypothetical protein